MKKLFLPVKKLLYFSISCQIPFGWPHFIWTAQHFLSRLPHIEMMSRILIDYFAKVNPVQDWCIVKIYFLKQVSLTTTGKAVIMEVFDVNQTVQLCVRCRIPFHFFCRPRFAKGESWRSTKCYKLCRLRWNIMETISERCCYSKDWEFTNSCMKLVEGDYQNSFAKFARLTVWCNTAQEICGSKRHMQSMDELLIPRPLPEHESKLTIMQGHQGCEILLSVGAGKLHSNEICFFFLRPAQGRTSNLYIVLLNQPECKAWRCFRLTGRKSHFQHSLLQTNSLSHYEFAGIWLS